MGADLVKEPKQTSLIWIEGSPEGSFYAPPGFVVINQDDGTCYRKTTPPDTNTGWQIFSSGGTPGANVIMGMLVTNGLPVNPPPVTSATWLAFDPSTGVFYVWYVPQQLWE